MNALKMKRNTLILAIQTPKIHSSNFTWKWRGALYKTTILYIGPSISFHVNLGEGMVSIPLQEAPNIKP